jgi:hypothetical protein
MDLKVEDLRDACRAAALVIPFKSIKGMEEFADDGTAQNIGDLLSQTDNYFAQLVADEPVMTLDDILESCSAERPPFPGEVDKF